MHLHRVHRKTTECIYATTILCAGRKFAYRQIVNHVHYRHGSRTLWPQDMSARRHFGTNFKPNHRWSCVLSELSRVKSVPTFRRSDAEASRATFLVQKCLETVLKCRMRVRSVLVPKCLVAEVSGNHRHAICQYAAQRVINISPSYEG